jgi:predicted nucleic acid-binding Zn finger protein
VTDEAGQHTVTVRAGAEPFCPCEKYQFNRKMWGEGKCAHTEAVQAEREKRKQPKKN